MLLLAGIDIEIWESRKESVLASTRPELLVLTGNKHEFKEGVDQGDARLAAAAGR